MGEKKKIYIRKLEIKDLPLIQELNILNIPEHYTMGYLIKLIQKNNHSHVLIEEDKIVGYILLSRTDNEAHIISICLDSRYRYRGLGTELLSIAILDLYKSHGPINIFLHTRISNYRALYFYRKFGFYIDKTIENYYGDGEMALKMCLVLDGK